MIFIEGSMERRFSSEKLCEQKKGRLRSNAKASGSQLSKLHSGAHTETKMHFWLRKCQFAPKKKKNAEIRFFLGENSNSYLKGKK